VPLVRVKPHTEPVYAPISSVPPFIFTLLEELSALFIPQLSVPALIVVVPVYVFKAFKASVPAPFLVRDILVPEITPEIVRLSASTPIAEVAVEVIAPCQVLFPEIFLKAPSLETPLPLKVKDSVPTVMPPCICKAAPDETVVAPAVVPRA
jgi:hypothetical protein